MLDSLYLASRYQPSELEHHYGTGVHVVDSPYLLGQLARLCAPESAQPAINELLTTCYQGLFERVVCGEFPRTRVVSDTRMIATTERGRFQGEVIDSRARAVTVNIARAGSLPSHVCFELLNRLLDPSGVRQDHLIMNRTTDDEGRVTGAGLFGAKVGGDVTGRWLLFPDPMAATGSSLVRAIQHYKDHVDGSPAGIVCMHLIVTPEYIRALQAAHPEVVIYALRLDRGMSPPDVLASVPGTHWDRESGLDERQYIVPGGGGFGEILNNAEV